MLNMIRDAFILALLSSTASALAADWPQWRGPDRTNLAVEQKLLTEWPKDGPPLVWKIDGFGEGVPSVAVAGGQVYVLGYKDGKEYLTALAEKDGKAVWSTPVGPEVKEMPSMRYLSQRTPTVDGDRVYAFTARGLLICFGTANGKEIWRKDYVKDFAGKQGTWGYCDFPLVDGDRLVCTPGGTDAGMVALHKKTGEMQWKCAIPNTTRSTYGGVIVAEIAGVRQYVHQLETEVVGVSTDGKLLWDYPNFGSRSANVHTALVRGDEVFASCGWGIGAALLKIKKDGEKFAWSEEYRTKKPPFDSWVGSSVRLDNNVHATNGLCIDWKTGEFVKSPVRVLPSGRVTMTAVDGMLIHRAGNGLVTLTTVSTEGVYTRTGEFKVDPVAKEPTWTFPVVANGRLYLRDQNELRCYDLRPPAPKPPVKEPDAIFVPTPQDVVEKMLEAAKVTRDDLVVDLGCGDGRIVVTAAKKYECKAIGYDLDPECVRLSRDAVEKAGLGKLVQIKEADIFAVDMSGATVATLYLGTVLNAKLAPQLEKMKRGSRVVSHNFPIPGLKPERELKVTSDEDDVERPIYLYTVPLMREKP